MKNFTLTREDSVLFVIDVQKKLMPPIFNVKEMVKSTRLLLEVAKRFALPMFYTEQYPKGLGPTDDDLRAILEENGAVYGAKTVFNGMSDEIRAALEATGRKKVIIAGMETHVCVFQTVRELLAEGYEVFVATDAVGSRSEANHNVGLAMMDQLGAHLVASEVVMFDLLHDSKDPNFKELQEFIK